MYTLRFGKEAVCSEILDVEMLLVERCLTTKLLSSPLHAGPGWAVLVRNQQTRA